MSLKLGNKAHKKKSLKRNGRTNQIPKIFKPIFKAIKYLLCIILILAFILWLILLWGM
jgi:cell division septal protein FtsQ